LCNFLYNDLGIDSEFVERFGSPLASWIRESYFRAFNGLPLEAPELELEP
jgi:hypothetical protein